MKTHPSITMLQLWAGCALALLVLPFELVNRTMSVWGFFLLAMFIGAFCLGGLIRTAHVSVQARSGRASAIKNVDFHRAELLLIGASLLASLLFAYEMLTGNVVGLEEAYQVRTDRASDLMMGLESQSSVIFQVAFLLYPAAFIYLAMEIVLKRTPQLWKLALFGGLPLLLGSLVMGGRSPLLLAFAIAFVAFRVRRRLHEPNRARRKPISLRTLLLTAVIGTAALAALNYFIQVFLSRAETAGGVGAMLDIAESSWGMSFGGESTWFIALFGEGTAYLIFVFTWYLIQGLVMSNVLFTDYQGEPHFGIYGLELVTAVMRRIDGSFVADRNYALLELNTYGFFPSAFGSLYVDFSYGGLLISLAWGYIAAFAYYRCRERADLRWFLAAPIILVGIFFSLINTPLGFSNGTVTHLWLIAAIFAARSVEVSPGAASALPAGSGPAVGAEPARAAPQP